MEEKMFHKTGSAPTSLAAWGLATQANVISAAWMTSEGVRPWAAPTLTNSSHCNRQRKANELVSGNNTIPKTKLDDHGTRKRSMWNNTCREMGNPATVLRGNWTSSNAVASGSRRTQLPGGLAYPAGAPSHHAWTWRLCQAAMWSHPSRTYFYFCAGTYS